MKQRKSYQEQKEILQALRQGKIQKLVMNATIDSGKERALKVELDRIIDSFKGLFLLVLTPFIIPLLIIPAVLLFIISLILIIKELLVSTFRLLTLPFKML
jgi:hypothetical protein